MLPETASRSRTEENVLSGEASPPSLAAAALATVTYHDLLDLPLTAVGVWRYLLRPKPGTRELKGARRDGAPPPLSEVEDVLRALVTTEQIETRYGFYFFSGRAHLVDVWLQKHARSQEKWRRLRRIVFWLQATPFLRGVAGTGSLAFDNAKETSDLDVLIIAAPNRVWTVRFFLTLVLDLFQLRRRPAGPTRDRVCLNHYVAADALEFPYRSLYTAMEYARLVPLLGEEICRTFRAANRPWMEQYLARVFPDTLTHRKTVRTTRVLRALQASAEVFFRGALGDALERLLARLQRARIARAEITASPHGRVVATDVRAEFHPHSREGPLLRAFNARMETLGLADLYGRQGDSGLTL